MAALIDSVAEVFSTVDFPSNQISENEEYFKGVIKIFLDTEKNVLDNNLH
jgi:hypothetical protein